MEQTFDGLLVVDKPYAMTSRDAVTRAQTWFPRRLRIGHTGTLDPLATGVLVLCLGRATRLGEYVQLMSKTYRSIFHLGATSDCHDAEGEIIATEGADDPGRDQVEETLASFVGAIDQVPPTFSAAKVTGKRAYSLARMGREVQLDPRTIQIYGIDLLRYNYPEVEVEVRCGKGTYIRSLARDVGEALGCGAYVQMLRRTSVGPFSVEGAADLDMGREQAHALIQPMGTALADLPRVEFMPRTIERFRSGQVIPLPMELEGMTGEVGVFNEAGVIVAVGLIDPQEKVLRPMKVVG